MKKKIIIAFLISINAIGLAIGLGLLFYISLHKQEAQETPSIESRPSIPIEEVKKPSKSEPLLSENIEYILKDSAIFANEYKGENSRPLFTGAHFTIKNIRNDDASSWYEVKFGNEVLWINSISLTALNIQKYSDHQEQLNKEEEERKAQEHAIENERKASLYAQLDASEAKLFKDKNNRREKLEIKLEKLAKDTVLSKFPHSAQTDIKNVVISDGTIKDRYIADVAIQVNPTRPITTVFRSEIAVELDNCRVISCEKIK